MRHLPFREHLFRHETGGPVFYWSISGKPLFEANGSFAGYRITASDVTRLRNGFAAAPADNLNRPGDLEAAIEPPAKAAAAG
jgi:hypothetical protein